MSFIPENTPFIALPTALKGKVTPYQLTVIWVLQSYYPNIWPSYQTIAKDAKMSRSSVIRTVNELVELGLLQKQYRIDELNQTLKPLKEFIMPGGDEFCSRIHLARAVCRRAERSCVAILDLIKEKNIWLPYLNRLSDYLFVLARYVSSERGSEEILWKR